jgi:predicted nucleic acid-binding protein
LRQRLLTLTKILKVLSTIILIEINELKLKKGVHNVTWMTMALAIYDFHYIYTANKKNLKLSSGLLLTGSDFIAKVELNDVEKQVIE